MSSILGFPLMLAKSMLLFPLHLLLGSFRREKPGQGAGAGVWAASMGGARGTVYMGRMGILPAMLIVALVTMIIMLTFVVAGAVFVALSPVLLVSRLLHRPAKPALDGAIPTTGRIEPDEPVIRSLHAHRDGSKDAGR